MTTSGARTDLDQVKVLINEMAARHEHEAADHAALATRHTDQARQLRELSAMVERHALRTTAGV